MFGVFGFSVSCLNIFDNGYLYLNLILILGFFNIGRFFIIILRLFFVVVGVVNLK